MLKLLAFDYGASSGRAILGKYDGETLQLEEIHRFTNVPVMVDGTLYWDILRLFHEMKQGIHQCKKIGHEDFSGIGVDTWGVDFGLLGPSGELLGNPVHYRDKRTDGMLEKACGLIPKREIYRQTGTQFMQINTLYQLLSMKSANSRILDNAATLLLIPDLFNYFLTGEKTSELSIATTTQMFDWSKKGWTMDLLDKLGVSGTFLTPIIDPGSIIGSIRPELCSELEIGSVPVIAVAGHDTESAMMAVPADHEGFAYLSCGTWSLLGMERNRPVINDASYALDFTNEGGFGGTVSLHKNIMGLWIYQECRRTWNKEGRSTDYKQLEIQAMGAKAFTAFIDPDDPIFLAPANMPARIVEYCIRTKQEIPKSTGAFVRCILESLALKYRLTLEELESITGDGIPVLHIVGGGSKDELLCRFTANAIGRPVIAGPVEATAIGNILCQMLALHELGSLNEARSMIRRSFPTKEYLPVDRAMWEDAFERYKRIIQGGK